MIKTKNIYPMVVSMAITLITSSGAEADGTQPVTSGAVIRGVTLADTPRVPGTSTGKTCNFSDEVVNQAGQMTGASVNCQPGGTTPQVLVGLPTRFNAYCVITDAKNIKSARLIQAPVLGNQNHCDLSSIIPKDATGQFKGAVWR